MTQSRRPTTVAMVAEALQLLSCAWRDRGAAFYGIIAVMEPKRIIPYDACDEEMRVLDERRFDSV